MRCKTFVGDWYDAQDAFNKWAKGKELTKNVIIHTHTFPSTLDPYSVRMAIIVIHPDTPEWNRTEPEITAPVHTKPEPHIKMEEVKVTA